jgi:hypothetical protein
MNTIGLLSSLFLLCSVQLFCQEKLADVGVGYDFTQESKAFNLSVTFNRTQSADAEPGPYLKVFRLSDVVFGIRPSAQADFGKDVESSPNNVLASIGIESQHRLGTNYVLIPELDITGSSDKSFSTGLVYGDAGVKYLYYNNPSTPRFSILPSLHFNYGQRVTDVGTPNAFQRVVAALTTSFSIGDNVSKKNKIYVRKDDTCFIEETETTTKFKERVTFSLTATVYSIKNDTSVISNGTYGNLSFSVDVCLTDDFGLSGKYVVGREQPLFKKMNAVAFGIAFFR